MTTTKINMTTQERIDKSKAIDYLIGELKIQDMSARNKIKELQQQRQLIKAEIAQYNLERRGLDPRKCLVFPAVITTKVKKDDLWGAEDVHL